MTSRRVAVHFGQERASVANVQSRVTDRASVVSGSKTVDVLSELFASLTYRFVRNAGATVEHHHSLHPDSSRGKCCRARRSS